MYKVLIKYTFRLWRLKWVKYSVQLLVFTGAMTEHLWCAVGYIFLERMIIKSLINSSKWQTINENTARGQCYVTIYTSPSKIVDVVLWLFRSVYYLTLNKDVISNFPLLIKVKKKRFRSRWRKVGQEREMKTTYCQCDDNDDVKSIN